MKQIFCLICRLITSDILALCKMGILSKMGKKVRSVKKFFSKRRKKDHTAQSFADDAQLYVSVGRSGLRTVRRHPPRDDRQMPALSQYHDYEELSEYGGRSRPPDHMEDEVVWSWSEVPSSTGRQQMSHADVGMTSIYQAMGYLPPGYQSK